jgi:hypothetical protein
MVHTRSIVKQNTTKQADQMLQLAKNKCPAPVVGNTVQVPIPDVDKGPIDPNHFLCCVVAINNDKKLYQLGNKHGLLDILLPINGSGVVRQNLIDIHDVNHTKTIGIREMARFCSTGTGQGYIKCSC